jgi:hypothetical protein
MRALPTRTIRAAIILTAFVAAVVVTAPATALAKKKTGSDCAGLSGAAAGLCNAYCEAQNCPDNPDKRSCESLRRNFERKTGSSTFPCDETGPVATATTTPVETPVETATPVETPVETATPVETPVETATAVETPVETPTTAATPVETATGGATPVETATGVATPVETATGAATPVETATGAATPIETATGAAETPTPVETPAATLTAIETSTPVETATAVETPLPTATSTPGPTGVCPTLITFEGTSTNGVLDTGWTGQGHDATVISEGLVTVSVTSCAGAAPPCGVCSYTGPIPNAAGQIANQRCSLDSSVKCTTNTDCTGVGTCKFFFGTYLPLAAGGVSTCVENTFNGGLTGTANIDTGTSAGTANVTSRVFSGPTLSVPCPQCNGDATPNDGLLGGTCTGNGLKPAGTACDASGSSPNAAFGTTSLDCPPNPGGVIATLPIDLSNTTGEKTRTLSASSPNCRAVGFTTNKCQCDTCNNAAATPCSSNTDCTAVGATICGGRRCSGGANNGTPCAVASECPGGACNVPGTATAPNQCDGGSGDCVADAGTPSPNDRVCSSGPFEQFCSPVETFRGCTSDPECTRAGDTCTLGKFRDCFDNGVVGDTVTATGNADPPANHESDPTLAALFCIGPTSSSAVNGAAGLPGLGRLELTGHAVENSTP